MLGYSNFFVVIACGLFIGVIFIFPVQLSISFFCGSLRVFQRSLLNNSVKEFFWFNLRLFWFLIRGFFNNVLFSWQALFVIIFVGTDKSIFGQFSHFLSLFHIANNYHGYCIYVATCLVVLNLILNLVKWHDNSIIPCLKYCNYSEKDFILGGPVDLDEVKVRDLPIEVLEERKYDVHNKASRLGFVNGVGGAFVLVLLFGLLYVYYVIS